MTDETRETRDGFGLDDLEGAIAEGEWTLAEFGDGEAEHEAWLRRRAEELGIDLDDEE